MNKQTIIIALLAIILGTITASADIVKGRVVDSETKEPLPEAQIQFVETYDIGRSFMYMTADSLGCFNFYTSGRGSIEVSMLGYYSKSKPVMALSDSRKDTLDIGTIELKMSPQMLKMVEVTGRTHLHRKMKEMTGLTVHDFIQNIRMEQAARLLTEQKINITQVAYAVGYSSQPSFSAAFRKHFGVSPTEYISQHK